jgi:hypothetical protein
MVGFIVALTCGGLLALAALGLLGYLFVSLLHRNRLLALAILGALALHLGVAGVLLLVHGPVHAPTATAVLHIAPPPLPAPLDLPKPPKPTFEQPALPQGTTNGSRHATANPRGNDPSKRPGARGPAATVILKDPPPPPLVQPSLDPEASYLDTGFTDPHGELTSITRGTDSRGGKGENGGFRNGDPHSTEYARGDRNGTRDGRVYFLRLKYGSGAWNAHAEGIRRLLRFLDAYVVCESDSWAMTTAELSDRYLRRQMQPCFIYAYCDETFSLSPSEAAILRDYLTRGGFLFLDSRPDPYIKEQVANQLAALLPGSRLAPIAKSHPINRFLFQLTSPGVGFNIIDGVNYGVTRGDRLAVFYTMGNFAQLYAANTPESDEYIKAQYQMGANVMLYAIEKGNAAGMRQEAGANARITTQTLQRLLDAGTGAASVAPSPADVPAPSIKLAPADNDAPADIRLQDE